jgi:serine/threonine protein kinase
VLNGNPYDEKADLYSYAMVLYEMISNRMPFEELSIDSQVPLCTAPVPFCVNVFASVCLLYLQICLRFCFCLHMIPQVINAVCYKNQRPILPLPSERLPKEFLSLVQRCWDGDPKARPAFTEVVKVLDEIKFLDDAVLL